MSTVQMERAHMPTSPTGLTLPYLRRWRLSRLWTQHQVAQASGVARVTVERAEVGASISELSAERLARG